MNKNEIYYHFAQNRLDNQFARLAHIRLRATGLVGISTTLVGLAAIARGDWSGTVLIIGLALVVTWLIVIGNCFAILRPRPWNFPSISELREKLENNNDAGFALVAGDYILEAHDLNGPRLLSQTTWLTLATYSFFAEGAVLGALLLNTRT